MQTFILRMATFIGLFLFIQSQVWASASPTETVLELTEGFSEITSSTTGDKLQARQVLAQAEMYYADPKAPLGTELALSVKTLQKQQPGLSIAEAVDIIYANLQN